MGAEEGCDKVIDKEKGAAADGEQHKAALRASQPGEDRRHQQLYSTLLGNEPQEPPSHPRKAHQGPPLRKSREGAAAAAERGHQKDLRLYSNASDRAVGQAETERA